jgi:hypothetical protein
MGARALVRAASAFRPADVQSATAGGERMTEGARACIQRGP